MYQSREHVTYPATCCHVSASMPLAITSAHMPRATPLLLTHHILNQHVVYSMSAATNCTRPLYFLFSFYTYLLHIPFTHTCFICLNIHIWPTLKCTRHKRMCNTCGNLYVCMFMCVCVHIHTYVNTCMSLHVYVCIHACMCTLYHTSTCIHSWTHTHMPWSCALVCMYVCVCTYDICMYV